MVDLRASKNSILGQGCLPLAMSPQPASRQPGHPGCKQSSRRTSFTQGTQSPISYRSQSGDNNAKRPNGSRVKVTAIPITAKLIRHIVSASPASVSPSVRFVLPEEYIIRIFNRVYSSALWKAYSELSIVSIASSSPASLSLLAVGLPELDRSHVSTFVSGTNCARSRRF